MSLKTWKKEFYPETAKQAAKKSWLHAIDHSIRKWEGALSRNIRKHNVIYDDGNIKEGSILTTSLNFNANSCSLCQKTNPRGDCFSCPIWRTTGKTCLGAFQRSWTKPYIMVRFLKKVREKWIARERGTR